MDPDPPVRHALILAAGSGSRMGPTTAEQPKCLAQLAGQPLLEWQTSALAAAGIPTIEIVVGYKPNALCKKGYRVWENTNWASTNMVASILCATEYLRANTTVVSYGDIVFHPDNVRTLLDTPGDIVITYDHQWLKLWSARFEKPLDDAETFQWLDRRLLAIGERAETLDEIKGQYMGLLKLTRTGWSQIESFLRNRTAEQIAELDMTTLLGRLIEADVTVNVAAISGRWCEADTENDLRVYESHLDDKPAWSHDWRW